MFPVQCQKSEVLEISRALFIYHTAHTVTQDLMCEGVIRQSSVGARAPTTNVCGERATLLTSTVTSITASAKNDRVFL